MPYNLYWAKSLTGGVAGALDAIDGLDLADLDAAIVIKLGYALFYSLDTDSGAEESSPDVIIPDANAGAKRWVLTGISEITAAAMKQLKNIGATEISAGQWAWLGGYGVNAKARAYKVQSQNDVPDNTFVRVRLDGVSYDPGDNYDNAVNFRFTAPVSGYYQVYGIVSWAAASVIIDKLWVSAIYKNDVTTSYGFLHSALVTTLSVPVADILYLDAGDYVELWAKHMTGAGTPDIQVGTTYTYLVVHFLSS